MYSRHTKDKEKRIKEHYHKKSSNHRGQEKKKVNMITVQQTENRKSEFLPINNYFECKCIKLSNQKIQTD
jgi:hypothetical protein